MVRSAPRSGGEVNFPALPAGGAALPDAPPPLTLGLTLPEQNSPYNSFLRHAAPNPLPGKWTFYAQNLRKEFARSYVNGGIIYAKNVTKNPAKLSALLTLSTGFGLLHAMFHHTRLQPFLHLSFLTSLLLYPIMKANQIFPYFSKSYELTRQGNPEQGKRLFQAALDESMYTIGNVYLKPITLAMALSYLISLPQIMRAPKGLTQTLINRTVTLVTHTPPISILRKGAKQINQRVPEFMQLWKVWNRLDDRLTGFGAQIEKKLPVRLRHFLQSFHTEPSERFFRGNVARALEE
ncbi:MAG: hypothetical protein AB7P76_09015 [Candidatus Melainabacteria bacterium]